jgi:hypothetical protein
LILAVNVNNAQDIPARITMEFHSQSECERAKSTMETWIKFDNFRVQSQCQRKPS